MHLVVAAHDLYPDPGSGGTGRYVYETARRFVDRGHRVSVVTRRRGDVPRRERLAGVEVYRYDVEIADRNAAEIARQLPDALRTVSDILDEITARQRPDLLSFQGPVTALLVDRLANDELPRSCTFHSPWPTEYRLRTRTNGPWELRRLLNVELRRHLEGSVVSRVDQLVALSRFMRDRCREQYDPPAGISVVPGGVDADRFRPDAGSYAPVTDGDPAILTVRRLSPRMGHGLLLDAFAALVERRPGARLYVAGDGPLRAVIERTAADLGVADRTTFLGYVPDEELPAAYATADVFALPTTELEGFGLATLEALASGTPVVATPVGGTVEILADLSDRAAVSAPMLVPSVATADLSVAMAAWADLSESEYERAARECRDYVRERYAWDRTVSALESRYRKLLSPGA